MQTDKIKISKIRPNTGQIDGLPQNPRLLKDDRFRKLVKSIEDDPEMLDLRELIVVPKDGIYVVIAGNMRLRAMQELKMKEAPCKVLPADTTIEKLKAYTIKDNVPFGEHDWSALANEWDAEQLAEWGLDLPHVGEDETDAPLKFEDASLQVRPAMEYVLIMAEPNSEAWEEMKQALGLKMVRRGGYKEGSAFDALGLERVLTFDDMKQRMEANADRDTE